MSLKDSDGLAVHHYSSSELCQESGSCMWRHWQLLARHWSGPPALACSAHPVVDLCSHVHLLRRWDFCVVSALYFHFCCPDLVALWCGSAGGTYLVLKTHYVLFDVCLHSSLRSKPVCACGEGWGSCFLRRVLVPFFVWWCLQNNEYLCFWTMINLTRNTCRLYFLIFVLLASLWNSLALMQLDLNNILSWVFLQGSTYSCQYCSDLLGTTCG